jgi:hypothetical protein
VLFRQDVRPAERAKQTAWLARRTCSSTLEGLRLRLASIRSAGTKSGALVVIAHTGINGIDRIGMLRRAICCVVR